MDVNIFELNVIKRPIGFPFELVMNFLFLCHSDFITLFLSLSK